MKSDSRHSLLGTVPIMAALVSCLLVGPWAALAGASRGPSVAELARKAARGEAGAAPAIEALLESYFMRKDLWTLDGPSGSREVARGLGPGGDRARIGWIDPTGGRGGLRLLTLDLGEFLEGDAAAAGYVAYAIVQKAPGGEPALSWYHDSGRKLAEQEGASWHPRSAILLGGAGPDAGVKTLVVEESTGSGAGVEGLLVFDEREGVWRASGRIAPPAGARLAALGESGALFLAGREPSKGVLTGAPPGLFRALLWYERAEGAFASQPVAAPLPEAVTAAELLIKAVRTGDRDEARRRCVSPDVLEAMLYFSPEWKGGGRVVKADALSVEFVYEERDRPTLRILLKFENRSGALLLASATGRAEKDGP
jgi:hypothetical protein